MKTIYKLLILGMVYLVSNTTYTQIVQYSDDGTKSCIDCEEKNSSTERSCLCLVPVELRIFNNEIAAVNTEKEKWLYEQELLLAAAITGINYYAQYHSPTGLSPDYNFQNIQKEYIKEVETNRMADGYIGRANDYLKNKFNFDDTKFESSSLNYAVLDIRKRTGTGTNIPYGDLKYEGQYLRNMSDASINSLLYEQHNIRSRQRSALLNFEKSQSKIKRYHLEGRISEGLANRYINHYNSLGYEDAIRFMTRYMVWINNQHLNEIPYKPFGNPNNIFVLEDHDYTPQLVETADLGQPMENFNPTVFNEIPDDVGLFNYAVNSLGTSAASFLKNSVNQGVKKATKSYLENQQYNANGLKLTQDIFKSYANNTPFPHNQYDYSLATGQLFSINFQDEQNKNRLFHMENHNSGNSRQFNGLGNLLSSMAQLPDRNKAYIGNFMLEVLKDNDHDMSTAFTGQQAFDLFHFRTYEYANLGRYTLGVDFNEFRGTMLWDNNIRFPSFLGNPIEIDAILAHEANDLPQFEHLLRVRDLAKDLQLNQAQTDWLVGHSLNFNEINSFSLNNNSEEAKEFLRQAIDILIAQQSVTTLNEVFEYLVSRNEIFYVDVANTPKVNPKKETKCFDITMPAKITIFVEQNIAGSREITANIGHTFIGIEQGNISRYLGFYPDNPHATLFTDQDGEIHDNSKSKYHVSISTEVTSDQLKRIINDINNFPDTYSLNDYNCSDFGIQIARKAGLNLPRTVGEYGVFPIKFKGRNPADLGEDIRAMNSTSTITIDKTGGNAPEKKGDC